MSNRRTDLMSGEIRLIKENMKQLINEWINEAMNEWTNERALERKNERTDGRTNKRTNGPTNKRTEGRTNELNERTNERMDPATSVQRFMMLLHGAYIRQARYIYVPYLLRWWPLLGTKYFSSGFADFLRDSSTLNGASLLGNLQHTNVLFGNLAWYPYVSVRSRRFERENEKSTKHDRIQALIILFP